MSIELGIPFIEEILNLIHAGILYRISDEQISNIRETVMIHSLDQNSIEYTSNGMDIDIISQNQFEVITFIDEALAQNSSQRLAIIENLQVVQNLSEIECAICLEKIELNANKLYCSHVFHQKCIKEWLKVKSSCPCCRKSIF